MQNFDIDSALEKLQGRESEARDLREKILKDFDSAAARKEIASMEAEATNLHAQIDALRARKNVLTRNVGLLQSLIDLKRPPNPLGNSTIGT